MVDGLIAYKTVCLDVLQREFIDLYKAYLPLSLDPSFRHNKKALDISESLTDRLITICQLCSLDFDEIILSALDD